MKTTGLIRRIDDLGRVVIPKEIRRISRIREGDPLEIFTDKEGEVILKKYSPIRELNDFTSHYADSLFKTSGHIVCITDKDTIIAVSGASKKEFLNKQISSDVERIIENRKIFIVNSSNKKHISIVIDESNDRKYSSQVIAPIISEGDTVGSVILLSMNSNIKMGEVEIKLAQVAAGFLGKQLEY